MKKETCIELYEVYKSKISDERYVLSISKTLLDNNDVYYVISIRHYGDNKVLSSVHIDSRSLLEMLQAMIAEQLKDGEWICVYGKESI